MRSDPTHRTMVDEVGLRARVLLGDDAADTGPDAPRPHSRRARPTMWDRLRCRVPVRVDPGRRGALALGLVVLVVAIGCGVWLLASRPRSVQLEASAPSVPHTRPLVGTDGATDAGGSTGSGVSSSPAVSTSPATSWVVVDVAGHVRRPGVYRLPLGSRVDDAVRAAGGPVGRVDLSRLNLAAPLVDGEQVPVGVPAATDVGTSSGTTAPSTAAGATSGPVDLNTATLEQLETLPGVGPVLGQDILDYRSAHGSFTSIDQLQDVSGIGDVKFGELKSLVTV